MDQGLGSSGSTDKSRILDVKPLRCLVPIFPSSDGMTSVSTPHASPFVCVPPTGPFPPGVAPFYPFLSPNAPQQNQQSTPQEGVYGFTNPIPSPIPLNSFRTPVSQVNGDIGQSRRATRSRVAEDDDVDEDGFSDSLNQSDQFVSGYGIHVNDGEGTSNGGKKRGRKPRKAKSARVVSNSSTVDVETVASTLIQSFQLADVDSLRKSDGDKELVGRILLVFDLFRRRLTQMEEAKESNSVTRRPDLTAGASLMSKGIRTNNTKRIGNVPGVEVGDIFFFRMELCLVGLHSPSMAGIDYLSVKLSLEEEPLAVSIVSSGGYDDEGDSGDVLIYSGQGGVQRPDGLMFDQKLERGNLALEKSLHRGNEVRVIRGLKDPFHITGKIYVYDGLYKIQESWVEKNKSGINVFKYKLHRVPGQPGVFTLWKSIQQWKEGTASRVGVILPDLTSGAEIQPVSLVNDVDDEKGPAYFTYIPTLKNSKPFVTPQPSLGCQCLGGCQPGDTRCPCIQKNGGYLPYTALGVLLSYKSLVNECGPNCQCPPNCRNRMSQAGLKVRLEVFKTKNRGWGLRSLDAMRAGSFICEFAGEVIDASMLRELGRENEDNYIFDSTRVYESLGGVNNEANETAKIPFPLVISAKNEGNVARFMNHCCSPNVYWQPVVRESNNESFYHIAFFAIKHITPLQELTFNYGVVPSGRTEPVRKKCLCGASNCRRYFY